MSFMFTYEELLIIIMCSAWICYTEVQISTCALNIRGFNNLNKALLKLFAKEFIAEKNHSWVT